MLKRSYFLTRGLTAQAVGPRRGAKPACARAFWNSLLRFLVRGVLFAETAVLLKLDPLGIVLFILERVVVALLAVLTTQRYLISHFSLCPLLRFIVFFLSKAARRGALDKREPR
jgi:hypothetical protein